MERPHDHATDMGREYYDGIVNFLNGVASLHPLDAQLNIPPERYSLELRHRVAENAAKSSFDETLETIEKTTGGHIPKRQVEELTQRAALDFDAFYV